MSKLPRLRIPLTHALPPPIIVPKSASSVEGAVAAVSDFLSAPPSTSLRNYQANNNKTVFLTGAGISVASGLADYRGTNGTYTLNKTYRPIYYNEFCESHEARKRYWARSFLGWMNLHRSGPNASHSAVRDLGDQGLINTVITQNVDSFHSKAHPDLPTVELHGYLRMTVCLSCRREYPRDDFQQQLSKLNPAWAEFLAEMLRTGALESEHPEERRKKGLRSNPDGDVDVPNAPYTTFRYPACPVCLTELPILGSGKRATVEVDDEGAWKETSNAGVLKPAVIMFGESISQPARDASETAIDEASRILVVGSSLATYSAWRLAKRARDNGMPLGIVNLGGIRSEPEFVATMHDGRNGVRCAHSSEQLLPLVVEMMRAR